MSVAWLDVRAGASGDMLLGALVDAGADIDVVRAAVAAVGVEPVAVNVRRATRGGITTARVDVAVPDSAAHRTWHDVRGLLVRSALPEPVRERALDVFSRLARAEGRAHGVDPEAVHFHEVGALDAIADVVGVCAALDDLGIAEVCASPVALGSGVVSTSHGPLAVPGPAVVALLAEAGAPTFGGDAPWEACTPTGAALLAEVATAWGGQPAMVVSTVGYGAGRRGGDDDAALDRLAAAGERLPLPNVVRVVLGERWVPARAPGRPATDPTVADPEGAHTGPVPDVDVGHAVLLETNVDDLDPRLWPPVIAALLRAGAADAWLTPIVMKKGRSAHTLHVLVGADDVDAVSRVVFTETSAIGLRTRTVGKRALQRTVHDVAVDGQRIRVKVASLDGATVNAQPEYDDVAAAARVLGRPVKAVLADAVAAARQAGLTP